MKLLAPAVGVRLVKTLCAFGLAESATRYYLDEFDRLFPRIKLGFRTKFPEILVKLYAKGVDEGGMRAQIESATRWLHRKLGDKVISDTGESTERVVGDLLRQKKANLALAESCTGGLIADLLTNVPGSSDYFVFSAVTYANQLKMKILDVSARTLDRYGAVSEQTAKEMARGVQQVSGATYGLSVSGIAGPGGATDDKPVGTVCIGLATADFVHGHRFSNQGLGLLDDLDVLGTKSGMGRDMEASQKMAYARPGRIFDCEQAWIYERWSLSRAAGG